MLGLTQYCSKQNEKADARCAGFLYYTDN